MSKQKSNKILIIEDDNSLLLNLQEILEEEGFIVKGAENGSAGIKAAINWRPELIICDISMPKKNGYEVLKELNESDDTKQIPFIFLTAKVDNDDIRMGMNLGADDYIFKPFKIDDLLNSIKIRLEKRYGTEKDDTLIEKKKYKDEDKILFKTGRKLNIFYVKDIKYIKSESPYVNIKFSNGTTYLKRQTMDEWEESLPEKIFLRIHRGTIINTLFISKIEKMNASNYLIRLTDESDTFIISKRYSAKLREKFS